MSVALSHSYCGIRPSVIGWILKSSLLHGRNQLSTILAILFPAILAQMPPAHTLFPLKPKLGPKVLYFCTTNTQAKTIRPAILANSPISCQKSTIFPQPPITTPDSITMSRQVLYFLINTTLKSDYFRTANSLLIEPSWPYILSIRHRTL